MYFTIGLKIEQHLMQQKCFVKNSSERKPNMIHANCHSMFENNAIKIAFYKFIKMS